MKYWSFKKQQTEQLLIPIWCSRCVSQKYWLPSCPWELQLWSLTGQCRSNLKSRSDRSNRTMTPDLRGASLKSCAGTPFLKSMFKTAASPLCTQTHTHTHISVPSHLRRSVGVEKVPAGGRVSILNPDHLKPMRKRKRKEYLSPSEEDSDLEGPVRENISFLFATERQTCSQLIGSDRY